MRLSKLMQRQNDCTRDSETFSVYQTHWECWKIQIAGLIPRVSDSGPVGWGQKMCISNKFQVMLMLPGLGTLL